MAKKAPGVLLSQYQCVASTKRTPRARGYAHARAREQCKCKASCDGEEKTDETWSQFMSAHFHSGVVQTVASKDELVRHRAPFVNSLDPFELC